MYNIKIDTLNKGVIELSYTKFNEFAEIVGHQVGLFYGYVDESNIQHYLDNISKDYSRRFQERERIGVFDNLTPESVIVDIGSGVGVFDLILYKYINGGKFILVDKSEIVRENMPYDQYSIDHGFYNSWSIFEDIALNSDIDANAFTLLTPEDDWPEKVDLITSYLSYMWHYPKEVYWGRIISHLESNLCFDIINREEDIPNQISKELGKEGVIVDKPRLYFHWFMYKLQLDNMSPGKLCYWRA